MLKAVQSLNFRRLTTAPITRTFLRSMGDSKAAAPVLALPSTETATKDGNTTLAVGSSVSMDALGPVVVNVDGTLARINNWAEMNEIEKQNTLRILGKRNRQRREALLAKTAEAEGEKGNA